VTTIAFQNGILATDSRSSTPEHRLPDDEDKIKQPICFHCERPAWTGSDDTVKIIAAPKSQWKGERILAAATTGMSSSCAALRRLLQSGKDIESAWDGYSSLTSFRSALPGKFSASLVVVTATKLWVLEFRGVTLSSYQEPRDKPFASGSGRDAAMLAMTIMGADAVNAVWAARAIDPATGGPVRWFDIAEVNEEDETKKYKPREEAAMSREEAAAYVRNGFKKPESILAQGATIARKRVPAKKAARKTTKV
jgi:hypothetical protein